MLPNQARSREALITGGRQVTLPLASLIADWLPPWNGRRTWVLSKRVAVLGIVSVHRRSHPAHWEVDRVHVARGKDESWPELLQALNPALGRLGAERLFLRLPTDSPLEAAAIEAGFTPYIHEELYLRPKGGRPADNPAAVSAPPIRPGDADRFHLFRLYNCAAPGPVREAEGLNFEDWSRSREVPRGWRLREELILPHDGDICGWLRLLGRGNTGIIDLLVNPGHHEEAGPLVEAIIRERGHLDTLLCLLPDYQQFLGGSLQRGGFQQAGDFCLYMRRVTARVKETGLLPVRA